MAKCIVYEFDFGLVGAVLKRNQGCACPDHEFALSGIRSMIDSSEFSCGDAFQDAGYILVRCSFHNSIAWTPSGFLILQHAFHVIL